MRKIYFTTFLLISFCVALQAQFLAPNAVSDTYISATTSKDLGDKIKLKIIVASDSDRDDCYIVWEDESQTPVKADEYQDYAIKSKSFKLYGNIVEFRGSNNEFTALDISKNQNMQTIIIRNNKLTTFDISNNPNLVKLIARRNQIEFIDISNNPALESLDLANNQLKALNIAQNTRLSSLWCNGNNIPVADMTKIIEDIHPVGEEPTYVIKDINSDAEKNELPQNVKALLKGNKEEVVYAWNTKTNQKKLITVCTDKELGFTTDIESVESFGLDVVAGKGKVQITPNQPTSVTIYNLSGQIVCQENIVTIATFDLAKGLYIVSANRQARKIIIR